MRNFYTEKLKQVIRPALFKLFLRNRQSFNCPVCGYHGPFKDKRISRCPDVVRINSKCPNCAATERHRMMHLVLDELFADWDTTGKSLLHIAPEDCLKAPLAKKFATYHTADLLKKDVDFNEDIQAMSFPNGSYDCVLVSRVLTIPPDLDASLREIRRVLRSGGIAIIAEIYKHDQTKEFGKMINHRSREIGVDLLEHMETYFQRVDCYLSSRYEACYQLSNMMKLDGRMDDRFPKKVKIPDTGFMELVAICHA